MTGSQRFIKEALRLEADGQIPEARSSLLVASCLFPTDADVHFQHWRLCFAGGEDAQASRILEGVSSDDKVLADFCELLLAELKGEEEPAIAREGCIDAKVSSCCLRNPYLCADPREIKREEDADGVWRTLRRLTLISRERTEVRMRAAEFAFGLDDETRKQSWSSSSSSAAAKEEEDGKQRGKEQQQQQQQQDQMVLCTKWSKHLSGECLVPLIRGLRADSTSEGAMPAEQVLRLVPMMERAMLHHVGCGQWRELRCLTEDFAGACNFGEAIRLSAQRAAAGARCVSHSIAMAACEEIKRPSGVAGEGMPDHVAAAARIAVLGSLIEGIVIYSHACSPADVHGPAADGDEGGLDDDGLLDLVQGCGSEPRSAGSHGWFLVQQPSATQGGGSDISGGAGGGAEAGQKRQRPSELDGDPAGGVGQSSLGKQLLELSLLWRGMTSKRLAAYCGPLCGGAALWASTSWSWASCVADILWYCGDTTAAAQRLEAISGAPEIVMARCSLQIALCRGGGSVGKGVKEVLVGLLDAGGAQSMQWYAADAQAAANPVPGTPEHAPLLWEEIAFQCLLALLHTGQRGCPRALPILVCADGLFSWSLHRAVFLFGARRERLACPN
jgi:hypothetical protein